MSTTSIEQIYLEIPSVEVSFIKTLAKKMGWSIKRKRKSGIQQAMEDFEAGRVYEAKNVEDLIKQLEV